MSTDELPPRALLFCFENSHVQREVENLSSTLRSLNWNVKIEFLDNGDSNKAQKQLNDSVRKLIQDLTEPESDAPVQKVLIYYGGLALKEPESGAWMWHAQSNNPTCINSLVKVDPSVAVSFLSDHKKMKKDMLFIFHSPFDMQASGFNDWRQKSNRPPWFVQVINLPEPFSSVLPFPCTHADCGAQYVAQSPLGASAAPTAWLKDRLATAFRESVSDKVAVVDLCESMRRDHYAEAMMPVFERIHGENEEKFVFKKF